MPDPHVELLGDDTPAARTLAAVFAHPDDETFAMGATLPRYAAAGVALHLLAATDGDGGRASGIAVASREELGRLRRAELHEAARRLGVRTVTSLGHPDGGLPAVDADLLVGEVVRFLRARRPDVVVTFGPEGAPNLHRDHRAISRAATAAFFLAALPTAYPEQLAEGLRPHAARRPDVVVTFGPEGAPNLHRDHRAISRAATAAFFLAALPTAYPEQLAEWLATHAARRLFYVAWRPGTGALAAHSVPVTARLDATPWDDAKRAAFDAHRTQHEFRDRFEEIAMRDDESYALVAGAPQPRAIVEDLFEGL